MSTVGSSRSGEHAPLTPPESRPRAPGAKPPKKTRIFRWQGIIPIVVVSTLLFIGWRLLAERVVRGTISEAGTKALGAQLDLGAVKLRVLATTIELRQVALADPFDANRNLFEIERIVFGLEPRPLLQKKFIVKEFGISDIRTGTTRATPARPVTGGGFAPSALAEVKRFAGQLKVPLMSLVPLDSLKALVLDPSQLKAVQAATALARDADSAKAAIEGRYAALRIQEVIDSSAALAARLQGTNVRTLGVDGARRAIADVRRAVARVDSAKGRVDGLLAETRRRADSLEAGFASIDAARRADYDHARSLLQLPSLETPDIGAALFGKVTIDRFEQAVYWSTMARKYAPPGLLPRKADGPERVRASGSTIHFVTPESYPRFLLRSANLGVAIGGANYRLSASDVTSDPAIVGRPTLFALRRSSTGTDIDSLLITGSMDHVSPRQREVVSAQAAGVKLPAFAVPSLPYSMDPGRGTSELRFTLVGDTLVGRWAVRTKQLTWKPDSARARRLNSMETLVARVLTGIQELELTADIGGTLREPKLEIKSNLDRQVSERMRSVLGQEIAAAEAKVRAQVNRMVDEKSAPVRAKVDSLRSEGERRVADARTRLDEEKRKLEERLKALGGGVVGLPRLPGT